MDEAKLMQAIGSTPGTAAIVAALVIILYKVGSRVADRLIAAIDRIAVQQDQHEAKEADRHAETRAAIVRVETKLDSALDWRDRHPIERPSQPAPDIAPPERDRTPTHLAAHPSERRRKQRNPHG